MKAAEKLALLRDPSAANSRAIITVLEHLSPAKGEPGYSPVKGVDYFTPAEIAEIVNFIQSQVKDGETPVKGIHYDDGAPGQPGKNGATPLKGVDYFTLADRDRMVQEILSLIPKHKERKIDKAPRMDAIIAATLPVLREELSYTHLKDAPDIKDVKDLIAFLKRGGFRGGGGTSTGGTTAQMVDLSSQCDGVNKTFTVGTFTTILGLHGSDAPIIYRPTVDFTPASPTITLTAAVNAPSLGATLIANFV